MSFDEIEKCADISFIDNYSLETLKNEMIENYISAYKNITGKDITLSPADPIRLILYSVTLQLYQVFEWIDNAGKQNFLKYAYGNYLDHLAAFKGIYRNAAKYSSADFKFSLDDVRTVATVIPAGTKVTNGDIYFATSEYAEIAAGEFDVTINAICVDAGSLGNGFAPGEITTLVSPIAYISKVSNISTTAGGTDIETDQGLSERIYLAPHAYSVAGPAGAYEYWTKTYNQQITDVKVTTVSAGCVSIRFLYKNSIPTETIIEGLKDYLMDSNIRPLTDNISVGAPDIVEYYIDFTYYIDSTNVNMLETIQSNIKEVINTYKLWQEGKIGRDINPSYLIYLLMQTGIKRVAITAPIYTNIDYTSIAKSINETATYGGVEND